MNIQSRLQKYKVIFVLMALTMSFKVLAQVRNNGLEVVRSTQSEIVISYTPQFEKLDTLTTTDGERVFLPHIVGASGRSRQFGAPSLLEITAPLAVPSPTGFSISTIQAIGVKRIYQKIAPIATPHREGEFFETALTINPSLYQTIRPQEWASVQYGGIARNRHIADLSIVATRYDAVAQAIEIPSKIIITLQVTGGAAYRNTPIKNDFLALNVLNAEQAKNWIIEPAQTLGKLSGQDKILSIGKWVKIGIESEGVYKIDASMLAKYGITLSPSDVATLKIFGLGGLPLSEDASIGIKNEMHEQPIIVRTKPNGELDAVIFYASGANGFEYQSGSKTIRHFLNSYSKDNYYVLTYGGTPGVRASELEAPSVVVNRPTSCTARIFNEEEVVNAFAAGSGRTWFGRSVDNALPQVFTTPLPILSRTGTINYRYSVAHRSSTDGTFTVSENGTTVGKVRLPGIGSGSINYYDAYAVTDSGTLPASSIASDGRSVLKFAYSADGNTNAAGLINWFEIQYPQECVASNNSIEFYTDSGISGGTEYSVNGFSGEIFGFDVTDRSTPKLLKNFSSTGGIYVLRSDIPATSPKRFYLSSQVKTPRLETADVADLRTNYANTDVIVITHSSLLASANKFKEYRESQKELTVSVVTTEQIYNEFSGGMPDVTALRDYLGFAYTHWSNKPKYVILWGDGHYDYKNNQTQTTNFVPPYESDFSEGPFDETGTYTSDDYFARVVGNDYRVDLAIGRLTVPSPEAGLWMVEKIKNYEANTEFGDWQARITLVADDGLTTHGDDRTLHTDGSEVISRQFIPQDFFQSKIYMAEFPTESIPKGRRKPGVTDQLLNEVNSGTLLLNWVGHGSPRVWAHELVFERETTIPLMTNINKLFFLTAATCDFARFDNGDQQSAAEELVFSKVGGAIGIFAAARPVFPGENERISQDFYTAMFTRQPDGRYPRLGDMMYNVKQNHTSNNDEKYFLLGDPTMRLVFPDRIVRIDAINDENVTDSVPLMPLLKALSTVKIKGSILPAKGGTIIDTSFNGKALLTMTDSDINANVVDVADSVVHNILEFGGTLNRSSYRVSNGKFEASFVMPKDLRFTNEQGRLFAYAFSETKTAKGSSRSFKVGGIVSGTGGDKTGPQISIFMDDRTFQAGNLVRKSPLLLVDLFDETGINTTGSSIGHKIEVWFDENPTPIDLTPSFETSLDDSRKGTAQKQIFDLAAGGHTAHARAWDVLNNYSETRTNFRVATTDKTIITDNLLCYPNPTSNGTTISFQHNQSLPFTVEIHIFATDGSLVRSIGKTIEGLHTAAILWDGMDSQGARVAQGNYVYSVDVQAANGDVEKVYGNILVMR